MIEVKRGEIWICQDRIDAVGSELRKNRPVVIIQNDTGNRFSDDTIVAKITRNISRWIYPTQFDVRFSESGKVSRVQCESLETVHKSRLTKKIGQLNPLELKMLEICLCVSLGIGIADRRNNHD